MYNDALDFETCVYNNGALIGTLKGSIKFVRGKLLAEPSLSSPKSSSNLNYFSGWLTKKGSVREDSWFRRWFILCPDEGKLLFYASIVEHRQNHPDIAGDITLQDIDRIEYDEELAHDSSSSLGL